MQSTTYGIMIVCLAGTVCAQTPQEMALKFVPAQTKVSFTLGATLHTVHGSFELKRGAVQFDPTSNRLSGEILVDGASGHSGNEGRDKKMHKEVLESARFPDIKFRPDRVEGRTPIPGTSSVQVHGILVIHGTEHEVTIPVRMEMTPGHWTATTHFSIPYVDWGMKNPSTFVLRVNPSVDIDVQASGEVP